MRISAVVLTKDEERNIKECLESLGFCDEIIVVDDKSTDKTTKIARDLGARVFTRELKGDFAAQRNFGLSKAKGDWVLFVDADEIVTPVLRDEILNLLASQDSSGMQFSIFNGAYLKRKDYFLGRWLRFGETANVKLLRLAKKSVGKWKRKVHEFWQIEKGRGAPSPRLRRPAVGELKNPLLHYPHPTISQFLEQMNEYTSLDAYQFYQEGKRFQLWQMLFYPPAKFLENYCFRLGFLDGFPGLVIAFMMSLHSLITRAKLWEIEKKKTKKSNFKNFLIISILFLATFLRFWRLPELMMFIGDFGRDYLVARDMVLTHQIPLVGIPSSIPWLHQGPFSIWMIAAALWVGKFHPAAPAYLMAGLGVIAVVLVYWLGERMFGAIPALLASLLMATSPLVVAHARMPFHISPIHLFAILYFYSLFQLNFFWSGFLASTLFQFELSNVSLFVLIPLVFWLNKKEVHFSKRNAFLLFLGLLFPLLPRVVYDSHHQFRETLGFVVWVGYRLVSFLGFEDEHAFSWKRLLQTFSIISFYFRRFFFGY